jgi:hypothetical protein
MLLDLLREQVLFILSCNSETNHEGKIDYIQFVEMYYGPARSIGQYSHHRVHIGVE